MSSTVEPGTATGATPPHRRRRVAVAALVGVVLAALLVWSIARGGGGSDAGAPQADATASAEPTPTPSPTDTPSVPADPSPAPGAQDPVAPGDADPAPDVPALPEPLEPRPLTEEVELGEDAVAAVTRMEAVEGEPQGVGEIAGPALRFTIELRNTGSEPLPVGDAVVNVTYGPDATPATEISGPGRDPFTGQLAPGGRATGTYVFVVPVDARGLVSVALEYRFGAPIAVFQGSASAAPPG